MIEQENAEETENEKVAQKEAGIHGMRSRIPMLQSSSGEPLFSLFPPVQSQSCFQDNAPDRAGASLSSRQESNQTLFGGARS
jgi:hypothetical protein